MTYTAHKEGGVRIKLTIQKAAVDEPEIIIRCAEITEQIASLIAELSAKQQRLQVYRDQELILISPADVLYCECVDGKIFACTTDDVCSTRLTLSDVAEQFAACGFFRCSKSMVVNLNRLHTLRSLANGRIMATLSNGEQLLVSRQYARLLRERLKGGLKG